MGFATPTGKAELSSMILEKLGYDPLPYYWRAMKIQMVSQSSLKNIP